MTSFKTYKNRALVIDIQMIISSTYCCHNPAIRNLLRRFPSYYYELNFRIPNTGKTLTIIMLDTIMLCGNSNDFLDQKPRGPLRGVDANRQLTWLQGRLARSTADFLLLAGHYPVWSVSEHGPTECLLQRLHPLLKKYNATAYFCGHDHNLQVGSCKLCWY